MPSAVSPDDSRIGNDGEARLEGEHASPASLAWGLGGWWGESLGQRA
jgi:hypothetical protein